jgi:hypothetical protein
VAESCLLDSEFVVDTVIRASNRCKENFARPRYAEAINELIFGATGIVPPGYGLERDAVVRG